MNKTSIEMAYAPGLATTAWSAIRRVLTVVIVTAVSLGVCQAQVSGEETVLPSEVCHGLFIVPVAFGEEEGKTLHLVLDTGAEPTSVSPEAIARILGDEPDVGEVVPMSGGRIGDHPLPTMRVGAHSMTALSRALGYEIDGILGFPYFHDTLLTLDYPAEEIRVSPGRLPRPDGQEIFAVGGGKRPYLKVDVGGKRVPVLIDSGATGRFKLRPTDRLVWSVEPRISGAAVGFSGVRVDKTGRLEGMLQFGPLEFDDPIIDLTHDTRLAGWYVLRNFVLTFDQKSKRVRMQPATTGPVTMPPQRSIGLALKPVSEGFEVIRVLKGTAAEKVGLREGDILIAVDGIPVYERGCQRSWDDEERTQVTLSYLRDDVEAVVEIDIEIIVP